MSYDPDYRPGRGYLSNREIEATGHMIGGAVANICRELLERRHSEHSFGAGPHLLTARDGSQALCGGPGVCPACIREDNHPIAVEMLEALKGIESTYVFLDSLTSGIEPQHTNTRNALEKVRAAIAKAEGREAGK